MSNQEVVDAINDSAEPVYVKFGFTWKGAEWSKTTKQRLISCLDGGHYAHYDVERINGNIGITFYTANDML